MPEGVARLDLSALERQLGPPTPFAPHEAPFWDDEHIGRGMLAAHLDPAREAASRPHARIDREVDWIVDHLALEPGASIVDLGCGPGLYCARLARRGFRVTGIDISPVALTYARSAAETEGLTIDYRLTDYRALDLPRSFDAALLVYYDLGVLADSDRDALFDGAQRALRAGGRFVFDLLTPESLGRRAGQRQWTLCSNGGFWRPEPYLELRASYHDASLPAEVDQYAIVSSSLETRVYRTWNRGYTPDSIAAPLARAGFAIESVWGDLEGSRHGTTEALAVVAAKKGPRPPAPEQ